MLLINCFYCEQKNEAKLQYDLNTIDWSFMDEDQISFVKALLQEDPKIRFDIQNIYTYPTCTLNAKVMVYIIEIIHIIFIY